MVELFARRLVFGILAVPERLAHIVNPAEIVGMVPLMQTQQEGDNAPRGAGVLPALGGEGTGDHREERPVNQRVAVDEEQALRRGRGRHEWEDNP